MPKTARKPNPKHNYVPISFNLEPALIARIAKVAGPRQSSAFARKHLGAAAAKATPPTT